MFCINVRVSKYFVTFETTIWYLWELRLSRECPVREASPSDASGVVSRLATTINKCLALESNCETQAAFVVHYHNSDTRAEKATKGEILLLLSAFPIRGRHSGFSFSSFSYQLYPPPSLQPQPCPLSPHP